MISPFPRWKRSSFWISSWWNWERESFRYFTAIAVVGGKEGQISGAFPPCGVCRQVMREFVQDDFIIYMGGADGYTAMTMTELLPAGFKASEHMAL